MCQELAKAYEEEVFDLKALSAILEKQKQLWTMIGNHDRVFHAAYLVRFNGSFPNQHGAADEVGGKAFVYRSGNGKHPESVRDFTQRIKEKYPNSKVVNSAAAMDTLTDDTKEDEQLIQITTLSASSKQELEGGPFSWDTGSKRKAPLRMKKYYRENETDTYFYTNASQRKKNKKDNEFRSLWITKTFIVCQDVIPSMRRRVPVVSEKVVEFTPFQTAINNLVQKNGELSKTIETLQNDPTKSTHAISMELNGVLDAAVMGGVSKYREAFFDGTYLSAYPNETRIVGQFVDGLQQQMNIAKQGLEAYEKHAIDKLQPHVEHLKQCYKKQMVALSEFYKETEKYSSQ